MELKKEYSVLQFREATDNRKNLCNFRGIKICKISRRDLIWGRPYEIQYSKNSTVFDLQ